MLHLHHPHLRQKQLLVPHPPKPRLLVVVALVLLLRERRGCSRPPAVQQRRMSRVVLMQSAVRVSTVIASVVRALAPTGTHRMATQQEQHGKEMGG